MLSLVFWGVLLILGDFHVGMRIDNRAVSVDLLPDVLGAGLLAVAFGLLAFGDYLDDSLEAVSVGIATYFGGLFAFTVASWFIPRLRELPWFAGAILLVLTTTAMLAMCYVFREIAVQLAGPNEARPWLITGALVLFFYPLPQALATTFSTVLDAQALSVVSTIASLIPSVAFIISVWRLKRFQRAASGRTTSTSRGVL